jgi:hypothetical protein
MFLYNDGSRRSLQRGINPAGQRCITSAPASFIPTVFSLSHRLISLEQENLSNCNP